jgi:hypothetical protein
LARTQTRTSQPNKNLSTQSSQTLGHVRRLCCAAFPKLPVRHRCFLVHPGSFRCLHPCTLPTPLLLRVLPAALPPLCAARRAHPGPIPGRSARRDHSASCSCLHALPPWSCPCASHELSKSVTVGAPAEICDDRSSSICEDRSSRAAPYEDNRSPNPAAARTTDLGPSSCLSSS